MSSYKAPFLGDELSNAIGAVNASIHLRYAANDLDQVFTAEMVLFVTGLIRWKVVYGDENDKFGLAIQAIIDLILLRQRSAVDAIEAACEQLVEVAMRTTMTSMDAIVPSNTTITSTTSPNMTLSSTAASNATLVGVAPTVGNICVLAPKVAMETDIANRIVHPIICCGPCICVMIPCEHMTYNASTDAFIMSSEIANTEHISYGCDCTNIPCRHIIRNAEGWWVKLPIIGRKAPIVDRSVANSAPSVRTRKPAPMVATSADISNRTMDAIFSGGRCMCVATPCKHMAYDERTGKHVGLETVSDGERISYGCDCTDIPCKHIIKYNNQWLKLPIIGRSAAVAGDTAGQPREQPAEVPAELPAKLPQPSKGKKLTTKSTNKGVSVYIRHSQLTSEILKAQVCRCNVAHCVHNINNSHKWIASKDSGGSEIGIKLKPQVNSAQYRNINLRTFNNGFPTDIFSRYMIGAKGYQTKWLVCNVRDLDGVHSYTITIGSDCGTLYVRPMPTNYNVCLVLDGVVYV